MQISSSWTVLGERYWQLMGQGSSRRLHDLLVCTAAQQGMLHIPGSFGGRKAPLFIAGSARTARAGATFGIESGGPPLRQQDQPDADRRGRHGQHRPEAGERERVDEW